MRTSNAPLPSPQASPIARFAVNADNYFAQVTSESAAPGIAIRWGAPLSLVALWAIWMYATWAHWGNLSVDCGREMYVAAELAQGKLLYKDVWFNFGPVSPYFNSLLFRLFGVRIEALYWAGSLSALGSAIFLYLTGTRLCSRMAGWFAAVMVLIQAFHPSMFSFPLPYSFASAYGCLVACIFLWLAVRSLNSNHWFWIFSSGLASAVASLLKPEYGLACCVSLALLIAVRAYRLHNWKSLLRDATAILPGLLLFVLVVRWMISIGGFAFLTQENFQSWPTSYFMRTYGKLWFELTGFSITGESLTAAAQRTFAFLGIMQGLYLLACWKRTEAREKLLRSALFITALLSLAFFMTWREALLAVFYPQDMGTYILLAAAAAWWYCMRRPDSERAAAVALVLTFAALLAFRIMLRVRPWAYSIFYNGPALLSFLLLARPLFSRSANPRRSALRAQFLVCLGCLSLTLLNSRRADTPAKNLETLSTEHGTIIVPKALAQKYRAAIQFMKEKNALGESVLSVPEDTSLYFLSGTHCPSRVYAYTPGLIVPGKMTDELIRDIDRQPVRYLIWSNRIFPEYGVPRFGVDFDQTFGKYLTTHYHRVRQLLPEPAVLGEWNAFIWERNSDATSP